MSSVEPGFRPRPASGFIRRTGTPLFRLGLLAVLGTFAVAVVRGQTKVGDAFPPLVMPGLRSQPLPDLAGKVALVDFWASWCAPCKASFPAYARLHADFQGRGLVIIAVSIDERPEPYEAFVKRQAPPFFTMRDTAHELVSQVMVPAVPTCYLIGRDGRVRFVHAGFHGDASEQELRQEIAALLSLPPPSNHE